VMKLSLRYVKERAIKLVEDVCSVGDRGKQPIEVVLIDALWKERDHSEEFTCDGTEVAECWGGEREFYGRFKALVAIRPKHLRTAHAPLLGQSFVGPHVVSRRSCEQCDRQRVEIQLLYELLAISDRPLFL
jgi:hypothetical protein